MRRNGLSSYNLRGTIRSPLLRLFLCLSPLIVPSFAGGQPAAPIISDLHGEAPTIELFQDPDDDLYYIVTGGSPGTIIQFRVEDDGEIERLASSRLPLREPGSEVVAAAVDWNRDCFYLATTDEQILRVSIDDEAAPFAVTGSVAATEKWNESVTVMVEPDSGDIIVVADTDDFRRIPQFFKFRSLDAESEIIQTDWDSVAYFRQAVVGLIPGSSELIGFTDLTTGSLYGTDEGFLKYDIGTGDELGGLVAVIPWEQVDYNISTVVIDSESGIAHFGSIRQSGYYSDSRSPYIVDVALGLVGEAPSVQKVIKLQTGVDVFELEVDPFRPDRLIAGLVDSVSILSEAVLFDTVTPPAVDGCIGAMIIDRQNRFVVAADHDSPVNLYTIRLQPPGGESNLSLIWHGTYPDSSSKPRGALYDPVRKVSTIWTADPYSSTAQILKYTASDIADSLDLVSSGYLGNGNNIVHDRGTLNPVNGDIHVILSGHRVGTIIGASGPSVDYLNNGYTIPTRQQPIRNLGDKMSGGNVLVSSGGMPPRLLKLKYTDGIATPELVSDTTLTSVQSYLNEGIVDSERALVYYRTSHGELLKLDIGAGDEAPVLLGRMPLYDPLNREVELQFLENSTGRLYASYSDKAGSHGLLEVDTVDVGDQPILRGTYALGSIKIGDVLPFAEDSLLVHEAGGDKRWHRVKIITGSNSLEIEASLIPPFRNSFFTTVALSPTDFVTAAENRFYRLGSDNSGAGIDMASTSNLLESIASVASMAMDERRGDIFLALAGAPARISRMSPPTGDPIDPPARREFQFEGSDYTASKILVDPVEPYAYIVSEKLPPYPGGTTSERAIRKVRLGEGLDDLSVVATLNSSTDDMLTYSKMVGLAPRNRWLLILARGGKIAKYNLNEGNEAPTFVSVGDAIATNLEELTLDAEDRFAWAAAGDQVLKLDLGIGDAPVTLVSSIDTYPGSEGPLFLDATTGRGWRGFGGEYRWFSLPGYYYPDDPVAEFRAGGLTEFLIGVGTATPVPVGTIAFNSPWEVYPRGAYYDEIKGEALILVDSAHRFECAIGNYDPGYGSCGSPCEYITPVPTVATPTPVATPAPRLLAMPQPVFTPVPTRPITSTWQSKPTPIPTLPNGGGNVPKTPTITPCNTKAVALYPHPRLVSLELADGDTSPSRSILPMEPGRLIEATANDRFRGRLYAAVRSEAGIMSLYEYDGAPLQRSTLYAMEFSITDPTMLKTLRLEISEPGGSYEFAIYRKGGDGAKLWESGAPVQAGNPGWMTLSIADGWPPNLYLPPGSYWITFKSDAIISSVSADPNQPGNSTAFGIPQREFPDTIEPENGVGLDLHWNLEIEGEPAGFVGQSFLIY